MSDTTLPAEPVVIDTALVLELLDAAVADRGADYRYHEAFPDHFICSYVDDLEAPTKAACIAGHVAIVGLGIPVARFADFVGWVNGPKFSRLLRKSGWVLSPDAETALLEAQIAQDNGETWGDAVSAARAEVAA